MMPTIGGERLYAWQAWSGSGKIREQACRSLQGRSLFDEAGHPGILKKLATVPTFSFCRHLLDWAKIHGG